MLEFEPLYPHQQENTYGFMGKLEMVVTRITNSKVANTKTLVTLTTEQLRKDSVFQRALLIELREPRKLGLVLLYLRGVIH
jgi:light-regulated signal transduction histidine kinase (bacteriophytochrome)